MNQEFIEKAGKIVEKNTVEQSYCTLALIDTDGYPTVSTITASKADGIRQINFCTGVGSNKARRIRECNRASVCFNSPEYNITLVGTIEIVSDPEIKQDMWYEGLGNHFSGADDPNYCVLRFHTQRFSCFIDWKEVQGKL
jgi:general stress protein 26